ncbi:MAG: imidazoleglycerol-phosphate dehydratase HisB [Planctomycetota bacterium]
MGARTGQAHRKTKETDVSVKLAIDGTGEGRIATGVAFFDHMLELFARHGLMDLNVKAAGDLQVDAHHTVEDVGIALGKALAEALADKSGIVRVGSATVPMDDALAQAAVDASGRPYLVFQAKFASEKIGAMDSELVQDFLRALAVHGGLNLHVSVPYGENSHHVCEAIFKAVARALRAACAIDPREKGIPSTKGVL